MTQNIYDQEDFFKAYAQLPRSLHGLEKSPEFQVVRSWLPDLGCDFGYMCRWVRENGATFVHGIDISEKMISRAGEHPEYPGIRYSIGDLETLELAPNTFHVVYSSLALHYIEKLPALIAQIFKTLKPGGAFILSVEHPTYTAPRNPDWIDDAEGHKVWPLDSYLLEGSRTTNWLAEGVVKQHRTIKQGIVLPFCL
ncbi:hypothetical protein EYC80_009658 [Monilinia laxa]|uniref:Methyltransferase type 11 domain-containing protein n=1 Tax=Monilinia laxa TaxID=61186 RepID=A0A5N6JYU8_MONLA|nr:hypothetical protein EYC80_009658 [Monilinia laxa]